MRGPSTGSSSHMRRRTHDAIGRHEGGRGGAKEGWKESGSGFAGEVAE